MSVLTNAVLTKVIGPAAALDDNGDPGTAGDVLWTGRAAGYIKRVKQSRRQGDQNVPVKIDVFTILARAGAPDSSVLAGATWEACTVVIEDQRATPAATRQFQVCAAENRVAGTIADSLRLELEAETAPIVAP